MRMKYFAIAAAFALSGAPAQAARIDAKWPLVATAQDGDCALQVFGNGQFFRITATGLGAGEVGHYVLYNGDMKPIDWMVNASQSGKFSRYYLPFRRQFDGGIVDVSIATADCSLSTSFAWHRAGIRVID